METSHYANRFKDWKDKYNWDTCKTNRREYGHFIAHFLTSESRVINLDGIYGSGKTEFIRRLYTHLAGQKYPSIYIDVWESDFSNSPLTVICSEILQQIEFILNQQSSEDKTDKTSIAKVRFNQLKSALGTCLKYVESGATLTGELITAGTAKAISTALEATPDLGTKTKAENYIENVKKNHIEAVRAIKDIKEHITFISELIRDIYDLNTPIVILIDELDRCRPTYAIEVLEVIKHFFETEGCTFLVATNTEVLEHSVKTVYGQEFDAKMYLRRFFERKINLPKASMLDFLTAKELDFHKYESEYLHLVPFNTNQQSNIALFAALFENNNLELRDVEQILGRFFASLDYAVRIRGTSDILINTVVLIVGLIEQHLEMPQLKNRTNDLLTSIEINTDSSDTVNYDLSQIVYYMLESVILTTSKIKYNTNGYSTSGTPEEMLLLQSREINYYNLFGKNSNSSQIVNDIFNYYEKSNCNYWLWEDYKRVIELSGHIE